MEPEFKATPKEVIMLTIDRDYVEPKHLKKPHFEDASKREVSYGKMGDILNVLATPPSKATFSPEPVKPKPVKRYFWASIKRLIPNGIAVLVTAH